MYVRKRGCNVHVKIYDTHEMYVHVTSYEQMSFEFLLVSIPVFLHCSISFVYCWFYSNLFPTNTKILSLKKICLVCPMIFSFSFRKCLKFRAVSIFLLNYQYIIIICVLYKQSNQVWVKVSDNFHIKVLVVALFHLYLCLVWWTKPN